MTAEQSPPASAGAVRWAARDRLARELGEIALALHDERTYGETIDAVVRAAIGTVPGAEYAGIMQVTQGTRISTVVMTDPLVERVDQAQYETGEGPCLTVLREEQSVLAQDLGHDPRWRDFARRARAIGIASMLSFRLYVQEGQFGALNLYAARPGALDEGSAHVGRLFAAHAAVAMANAQQQEQLTEAVRTRDLIGQAKGILMERYKLTADQAFALLVRGSQHANLKLRDLAEHLVHSGELGVTDRSHQP